MASVAESLFSIQKAAGGWGFALVSVVAGGDDNVDQLSVPVVTLFVVLPCIIQ